MHSDWIIWDSVPFHSHGVKRAPSGPPASQHLLCFLSDCHFGWPRSRGIILFLVNPFLLGTEFSTGILRAIICKNILHFRVLV